MGRRALVTGGAVRVGRAISLALGEAGYDVAIHFASSATAASEVADAIRNHGGRAATLEADLTQPREAEDLVSRTIDRLGGLDLLVNNAAIFPHARPEEVSIAEWDRVFELNARAPFLCSRAAAAEMLEGGSIVNIADSGADEGWPGYAPYLASKAALVSLTRSLARAWAPSIRVNAVAPGPVVLPDSFGPEERAEAAARTALKRVGGAEDVAGAVLYLDRAEYVTGEVLYVDGGARLI
jgi:NAD(P)-dependent dehydrogenase (short-subunit alcohol dehydrogenase family)